MTLFELPYTSWTHEQLVERARQEGITITPEMTLGELIERLEARDRDRLNAPFDV